MSTFSRLHTSHSESESCKKILHASIISKFYETNFNFFSVAYIWKKMNFDNVSEIADQLVVYNKDLIYDLVNKISAGYKEFLFREFPIVLGCCFYFTFLVLSLIVYPPSYSACASISGEQVYFALIVLHSLLLCILFLYGFQNLLPDSINDFASFLSPNLLVVVVVAFFLIYGYLYFKCTDPICSSDNPCSSIDDVTSYNKAVNRQVDMLPVITELQNWYRNEVLPQRARISTCSNLYNASYRNQKKMGADATCNPLVPGAKLDCIENPDPAKGAPILSEFYIMTSNKTCVINYQYDYYVSTRMIEIALNAGARCLDFDICSLNFTQNSPPIVTVVRDSDNANMHHNYLTVQDVLKTIIQTWFPGSNVATETKNGLQDPLFLHFNIHPSVTKQTCDQLATLIRYYFTEYTSNKLLGSEYNYKKKNVAMAPICHLYGKVIIMIRTIGYKKDVLKESTSLSEVANLVAGVNYKDKEWVEVKSTLNKDEFQDFNRRHITFVRNSPHPYSNLSTEKSPSITSSAFLGNANQNLIGSVSSSTEAASDDVTALLMNKYSINNDPSLVIPIGCQFVAMNFQVVDEQMKKILGFFEKSSYILKPLSLRRKDFLYTQPVVGKYGTVEAQSCDSDYTDSNTDLQNSTYCSSRQSEVTIQSKKNDLSTSEGIITEHANAIASRSVFYSP